MKIEMPGNTLVEFSKLNPLDVFLYRGDLYMKISECQRRDNENFSWNRNAVSLQNGELSFFPEGSLVSHMANSVLQVRE